MREVTRRCIESLFNAAGDADSGVRSETIVALRSMAQKDSAGVLSQCCQWFTAKPASATPPLQRTVILKAMSSILAEQRGRARLDDAALRSALLQCGITEMTSIADLTSEWSREASLLVVEMCDLFPKEGCDALLEVLPSNALPHFFVISTLYTFADQAPLRFIPHLKEVLAKVLPVLGLAKQDNHKMLLAQALGSFAEAVITANSPTAGDVADAQRMELVMAAMAQNPREDFADVAYSAIHFITGEYSRSNELRVRTPVSMALGALFAICDDDKRMQLMPKVVGLVIAGVKREKPKDLLLPAKGFAAMLAFVSPPLADALLPQMDAIFDTLVRGLVALYAEGEGAHPEAKQAFLLAAENLTEFYVDGLLSSISRLLDPKVGAKDAATRATAIRIMQHLLSRKRCEDRLGGYKDSVVATLKLAMAEADWGIRRAVVLCIVNMGNSATDFFQAVGGTDLLSYVIRNAAVGEEVIDGWVAHGRSSGGTSPLDLRDFCRNTLSSLCWSTGRLDESLWPFLLEHMSDYRATPTLVNAFTTICPCLAQLCSRVALTERYYIDFTTCVNVPRPATLAAIFLTQVAQAGGYRPDELLTILEAMGAIAAIIDDPFGQNSGADVTTPIGELWLAVVPELQNKLTDEDYQSFEAWEEVLCKLASKTVSVKQSELWAADFVSACVALLPAYQSRPKMFRSALVFAGVGLGQSSKKDFVAEMLERISDACNHDDLDHRIGAAKAFGYVAAKHTDGVLDVLRRLAKGPEKKSGGGFFGGGASKTQGKANVVENSKSLAALAFGYVCRRMPREILGSRLDTAVLPTLQTLLHDGCTVETKRSIFEACALMESAIAKQGSYTFKARDALLTEMFRSLPLGAAGTAGTAPAAAAAAASVVSPAAQTMISTALTGAASLVRCTEAPTVGATARDAILDTVLKCISRGSAPGWADWTTMNGASAELLKALLLHDSPPNLEPLLEKVLPRTAVAKDEERHAAMHLVAVLVDAAVAELQGLLSAQAQTGEASGGVKMRFAVGPLVARLVPRFMDSMPAVRALAAASLVAALRLLEMKHADMVARHAIGIDAAVEDVGHLKDRAMKLVKDGTASADKEMSGITKGLCVCIVGAMPEADVFAPLLDTLLAAGLVDHQDDAASCSCVTLHGMIRGLGGSLKEADARRIFGTLMDALEKVGDRELAKNGVLVCIRNLTKHHNILCFDAMLGFPTPHSPTVVAAFQSIAHDASLSALLTQHVLDTVLNSQLLTDLPPPKGSAQAPTGAAAGGPTKTLVPAPLSAVCCLGWMADVSNGATSLGENRAAVLMMVLIYLSVAHESGTSAQVSQVVESLKRVLAATAEEITVDRVERYGWSRLSTAAQFPKAAQELTKYLCREGMGDTNEGDRGLSLSPEWGLTLAPAAPSTFAGQIAQFMLPYCSHPMRSYRRAALNVCGMITRYGVGHTQLMQSLIVALLSRTGDNEDPGVRAEVIECLQYLLVHPYEDICTFVSPVFTALLANMSESHVAPCTAALRTLSAIVSNLTDKSLLSPALVNLTIKLRMLFDAKEAVVRKHAFLALSQLFELGNLDLLDRAAVDQQIHTNLVPLLVHCEDPDAQATAAAKEALHEALKLVARSKPAAHTKIYQLLWKPHVRPTAEMRYEEFMEDFCAIWVAFFIGRVKDTLMEAAAYFNSDVESLRAATAVLFGQMLKLVPPEELARCNVEMASSQLMQMLNPSRERSALVRRRIAQAIGRLSDL